MKIGLFYGSSTCYTEMVAEKIRDILGADWVDLYNLKDIDPVIMENYPILILGIPTWDFGELQEDWQAIWSVLPQLNWQGKIVALYGLGDQLGYDEWFQDALGLLHNKLAPLGVRFVGFWPTTGYQFSASKAVTTEGKYFVGLALDDASQYQQTDQRLEQWCEQILTEITVLL